MFEKIKAAVLWVAGPFLRRIARQKEAALASKTTLYVVGDMNAGRGSCLFVVSGGKTIALDCGGDPSNGNGAASEIAVRIVAEVAARRMKYLVISHYHFDHFGALRKIVEGCREKRIPLPAIVCTDITWSLLERYIFEDASLSSPMLMRLGFRAKPDNIRLIPNRHSVPGSAGVLVLGKKNVLYASDCWDIDLPDDLPPIDVLIMCSTGACNEYPRQDIELRIRANILALIKETLVNDDRSNVYVAMISSQLSRATWLELGVTELTGFPPIIKGRSLAENLDIVRPKVGGHRSGRAALTTGVWAQGLGHWEGASAMVRLAEGTDKQRKLKKGDLVILSASIPVWSPALTAQIKIMCQKIDSLGASVVVDTSAPESWSQLAKRIPVHTGGHGNMPEIASMIERINPKQVLPFHASPEAREKVAEYCRGRGD